MAHGELTFCFLVRPDHKPPTHGDRRVFARNVEHHAVDSVVTLEQVERKAGQELGGLAPGMADGNGFARISEMSQQRHVPPPSLFPNPYRVHCGALTLL